MAKVWKIFINTIIYYRYTRHRCKLWYQKYERGYERVKFL